MSNLWQAGYLSMIALPARFALEAGGGVAYANWVWVQLQKTGDEEKAHERVGRLTMGARSPVELPWGDPATLTSINVMDFIDRLPDIGYDDARTDYEFLCESAHPSFLQHTFWNMVSTPASDFRNPLLDERIMRDLDRLVSSLETVCETVGVASRSLLEALLPVVEADASAGASG